MVGRQRLQIESEALALAAGVFRMTRDMPDAERWGLIRELRRSATSIGSNIAEGSGRRSDRELARFLDIAIGSSCELEFQMELACATGLATWDMIGPLMEESGRLRMRMISLKTRISMN